MNKPLKNANQTTRDEQWAFIAETLTNKSLPFKRIIIGKITESMQARIKAECGAEVMNINIDRHGVIHAMAKPAHNLKPDDLLYAVDIINTADNISLSLDKHKKNAVLIFTKNIAGKITLLAEVHDKNGYVLIFDLWRQKKVRCRRGPNATKMSPGLTS